MPGLTSEQIARRVGYATASQVPAILGADPWRSRRDAYHLIRGEVEPDDAGDAARVGHYVQPGLVRYVEDETGRDFPTHEAWTIAPNGLMAATLDAGDTYGVMEQGRVWRGFQSHVEAKSSGLLSRWTDLSEWQESELPDRVLLQIHAQFLCCPTSEVCYVPALLGGRGLELYRITPDRELCEIIEEEVRRFILEHVRPGRPPEEEPASQEIIKRLRREEGSTREITRETFAVFHALNDKRKQLEMQEKEAKRRVLSELGTAETGTIDGEPVLHYRLVGGKGTTLDVEALARDLPDVCEKYQKPKAPHRRLHVIRRNDQ